jgi:ABC-2 type transport system permease protein
MKFSSIKALLRQEFFITKSALEVIVDVFYFSIVNVILFALTSTYLALSSNNASFAYYVLLGILLWEIIRVVQYTMSVGALWNVWSRNLSNMFVGPLTIWEYTVSYMLSGLVKGLVVFALISLITYFINGFNILTIGWINLLFNFINLVIFGWFTGILILGIIFRYGTRVQSLSWGLIYLFQPLTGALFPVSILPGPLQAFAYTMPSTYVFDAARAGLTSTGVIFWKLHLISLGLNCLYFIASMLFFIKMFNVSKKTGQFVKNEG